MREHAASAIHSSIVSVVAVKLLLRVELTFPLLRHISIFTVMAYLNEGYGAGETVFQSADGNKETIVGKTGNLLIFNHDVQHAGLPIQDGKKYILRTDSTCFSLEPSRLHVCSFPSPC